MQHPEFGGNITNLVDILRRCADQQPHFCIYTFLQDGENNEISLACEQLDRQARQIAAHLQEHNIAGERVVLLYPPGLEFITAFFSCLFAGAVAVPAYPPHPAHIDRTLVRLLSIVKDAQPRLIITTAGIRSIGQALFAQDPALQQIQWVATDHDITAPADDWRAPQLSMDSLAFLQYTSGSTSAPKGTMLTHGNLLHNLSLIYRLFGHSPESRGVIWLPPYHDMGLIGGILQPLYGQFPVTLMSPVDFLQRPFRWLQAISRYRATTSGGPNFAFDLCVRKVAPEQRELLDLRSWRVAFNGAEPIRSETLERFTETFAPCGFDKRAFYPCYGLAEATLIVSGGCIEEAPRVQAFQKAGLEHHQVLEADGADDTAHILVSSGRTAPGQCMVIAHPETHMQCRPDEVGEIWLAGPSVAQGYWNLPEETRRTFQAYLQDSGAGPFLRTGDLGFIKDGEIFIAGRLKDLMIIRGRNHYPQDIERTVEASHPALRPGCGAAFSIDVAGEERVVVVQEIERRQIGADINVIAAAIRQAVAERHQVQVYDVVIIKTGSIPKTSSGKIQRRACRDEYRDGRLVVIGRNTIEEVVPEPIDEAAPLDGGQALRTAILQAPSHAQETLIKRFLQSQIARVLSTPAQQLKAQDGLPALGLDSLTAVELQHTVETSLGVTLPLTSFFGTITQLSSAVREHLVCAPEAAETFGGTDTRVRFMEGQQQLSYGQRALWFLQQLAPESAAYNLTGAVRICAELDVPVLHRAFQVLVERHEALRTTFVADGSGVLQQVETHMQIALHQEDASTWSEDLLDERLREVSWRPFDLAQGPLLRVHIFTRGPVDHLLLLVVHHIVADFWSLAILLRELVTCYTSLRNQQPITLVRPGSSYGDYIDWQHTMLNGPEGERLWAYWQQRLAGELPVLQLPIARPRPPVQTYNGAAYPFVIDPELTSRLKRLGAAHGATLFMTLLAAFQVLLYRYTGQEDILIGVPVAGRSRARFAHLIGYFVNPIVMRGDLSGQPSFTEVLARVRRTVLEGFAHQDYPFALLAERLQKHRDPSRSPLFQVMLILQKSPFDDAAGISALALNLDRMPLQIGALPLESVTLEQQTAQFDLILNVAEINGQLTASLQYNTDLFDASAITRMAAHFVVLIESLMEQPDAPIVTARLLSGAERRMLMQDWNATWEAGPIGCVHSYIEQQVDRTPTAVAVVFDDASLTYQELDERANQLARYLQRLGVGPEVRVGICVERSLELMIGLLGILKAGGAYVPLDPTYPVERLAFVLEDAAISVLLTQQRLQALLPKSQARTIALDADWPTIAREQPHRPRSPVTPGNLMYSIYTSGSTGKPKGVMITHQQVANFFAGMDQRVGCDSSDTLLAVTSISFDISVLELFWTLSRGAKVVLLSEQAASGTMTRPPAHRATKPLEFSLFYFASNEQQSRRDKYRLLLEGARFADTHGFTAVWTPERHFHAFGGLFPNPSVTSAAIAAMTQRVQIRGGSVVMPLHNPIRVAEEWSVVDNLSNGRVGIAFASGWHSDDFAFFPSHYADRKQIMLQGIATVHRLWQGQEVMVQGGAGNTMPIRLYPQPIQPTLPTWLTAAGHPETFELAGAHGMHVLTHLLGQSIDELDKKIQLYRASLERHGYDPQVGRVTLMLHTFIDTNAERGRELVREPFTQYLRSSVGLIQNLIRSMNLPLDLNTMSAQDMDDLLAFAFQRYFDTSALFGTPQSCQALLDRLRDIGVDEVACLIDFGIDEDLVLASLPNIVETRERASTLREQVDYDYSLAAQARRHTVTMLQCTPSMMQMMSLVPETTAALQSLRVLLLGGEALPPALAKRLTQTLPCRLINMYGPTETTIWSTTHEISPEGDVLIGRPIINTDVYILDQHLQPTPVLVPGQLHIGGAGLARGYHNRPDLTAERFIPHPFAAARSNQQPNDPDAQAICNRLYRTGDLARYRPDGTIEYLGRIDHQVKLRGFRIELEEIEHILAQSPDVRECVVVVHEHTPGAQRLVAYVVVAPNRRLSVDALRAFLRAYLPEYMIPSIFMPLAELPHTANGKIDRKALPRPIGERSEGSTYVAPQSTIERAIAQIWQEVLNVQRVGMYDNFFDLGGHSLLMAQVQARLSEQFQQPISLVTLFEHPTVRDMAQFIVAGDENTMKITGSARSRAQQQHAARRRRGLRGEILQ